MKNLNNWFKVKILDTISQEIDYTYTTGHNKFFVKYDIQQALGPTAVVSVKPISYENVVKETYKTDRQEH